MGRTWDVVHKDGERLRTVASREEGKGMEFSLKRGDGEWIMWPTVDKLPLGRSRQHWPTIAR